MKFEIIYSEMNLKAAEQICSWKYEPPYDVYNYMSFDEAIRNNAAIVDADNSEKYLCFWNDGILAAYASFTEKEEKIFIGIGLAPQFCGKGLGEYYLQKAVEKACETFAEKEIWVQVRSWNKRAVLCYRKCGFIEKYSKIINDRSGKKTEFVFMKLCSLNLESVGEENLSHYKEYEKVFEKDLCLYQSRIYPDINAEFLCWYHIRIDNRFIGSVWLEKNVTDDFAVLGIFIADMEFRNRGIGTMAIRRIIKNDLPAMNTNKAILRVRESNERAIACYKKVGFKESRRYLKSEIEIIEMEFIG